MNTVLCLVSVGEKMRQRRFGLCELMNPPQKEIIAYVYGISLEITRHKVETHYAPVVQVQVHWCQ